MTTFAARKSYFQLLPREIREILRQQFLAAQLQDIWAVVLNLPAATDSIPEYNRNTRDEYIIEHGYNKLFHTINPHSFKLPLLAVRYGRLELLQHIDPSGAGLIVHYAIEYRRDHILRWCYDGDYIVGTDTITKLALHGRVEMIDWLWHHPRTIGAYAPLNYGEHNYYNKAQYIVLDHKTVINAVKSDDLATVKWVLEHVTSTYCYPKFFGASAKCKNLAIMQLLEQHGWLQQNGRLLRALRCWPTKDRDKRYWDVWHFIKRLLFTGRAVRPS